MKHHEFYEYLCEMHIIYEQISTADLSEDSNGIIDQIVAEICGLTKLNIK